MPTLHILLIHIYYTCCSYVNFKVNFYIDTSPRPCILAPPCHNICLGSTNLFLSQLLSSSSHVFPSLYGHWCCSIPTLSNLHVHLKFVPVAHFSAGCSVSPSLWGLNQWNSRINGMVVPIQFFANTNPIQFAGGFSITFKIIVQCGNGSPDPDGQPPLYQWESRPKSSEVSTATVHQQTVLDRIDWEQKNWIETTLVSTSERWPLWIPPAKETILRITAGDITESWTSARHVPLPNWGSFFYQGMILVAGKCWTEKQHKGTDHGRTRTISEHKNPRSIATGKIQGAGYEKRLLIQSQQGVRW